ncbi:hypothetical protein PGQ11_015428 [Apiospora arundinis]|uniref:Uncharacterized protein n=1 Tax=Apiospora arundinis TaxID=335852 RepID=A0ABR2HLD3_9PEZI
MDTSGHVLLGTWTNWSRGSAVLGATLTMTRENGNFLIAFTALFVPFVASRFWSIFAILFHQCYSTSQPRGTIHHQRQVVLRNSSSPETGLISLARLLWAWRRAGRQTWLQILPAALFTIGSIVIFTVAGGFSSQISTSGEVLLKGDNCEAPTDIYKANMSMTNVARAYWATTINSITNYAQQCYSNQNPGLLECSRFVTRTVPTASMDYNAPCPFDTLCRRNNTNIRFDTGHLNSNNIFGLNAKKNETFTMRYVLQCAPLLTAGRTQNTTFLNHNFTTYNYGPMFQPNVKSINYTIAVPDLTAQYERSEDGYFLNRDLLLNSMSYIKYRGSIINASSEFYPDPTITKDDGDVSLYFLSGNGVHFMSRGDDDWYRAIVPNRKFRMASSNYTQVKYRPEEAASPLGCIEQYQWCRDPALGQCGKLEAMANALDSAAPWFGITDGISLKDRPEAQSKLGSLMIWLYLTQVISGMDLAAVIAILGSTSLASTTSIRGGSIYSIASNQWQLDVTKWWSIMLAGFQTKFVNIVQGTADLPYRPYSLKPANDFEWDLCHNQKILSAQYASFSIFGLTTMYSLGVLIIITSFVIEPILGLLQKHNRYSKYAFLDWEGDTAIQLQRVAQDELGYGHWSRCDETVPITEPDDLLAPFDISNASHPMLARKLDDTAPGDTKSEHANNGLISEEETIQKITLENSDAGVPLEPSDGVHRAFSDAHGHALRGKYFQGNDEESKMYQNRPGTAP